MLIVPMPLLAAPPAPPGQPLATVEGNRVTLVWPDAIDDEGVSGYNVYRDDRYVTTVGGTSYVTSLGGATGASFYITAFDTPTDGSARGYSVRSPLVRVTATGTGAPAGGAPTPAPPVPALPVPPAPVPATPAPATPVPATTPPPATPPVPPVILRTTATGDLAPPGALETRLVSNDWVEIRWAPVEGAVAYSVYRDGLALYRVDSTKTGGQDRRYWSTTSYVDCDYTRFLLCRTQAPAPGSSHVYAVTALDADGGESAPSNELAVQLEENGSLDVAATLADFRLVVEDEFDAGALDPARWNTRLAWGPDVTINGESQYFVDTKREPDFGYDPFVFTDDTLRITPARTPPELGDAANGLPYLSGVITTRDSFNFTYGYVEARMKVAAGDAKLSSFFLFQQWSVLNAPEIDITEFIGTNPTTTSQTYHYRDERDASTQHPSPTMYVERPDRPLDDDFHTYGVLWEPGLVVWTIDGEEVRRVSGPEVARQALYVVLYLVAGSRWVGAPDPDAADFGAPLEIDWLRVWQRPAFIR